MTHISDITACRPHRPAPRSLVSRFLHLLAVARTRQSLSQLDARTLKDIGLTPEQAQSEANRSFWDAPEYWRR
ncbi:MAG: DUF1127 domain-containing protein [Pseudomonadota bacterium]